MCSFWTRKIYSWQLFSSSCSSHHVAYWMAFLPLVSQVPVGTNFDCLNQSWQFHLVGDSGMGIWWNAGQWDIRGLLSPGGPLRVFSFKNEHKIVTDPFLTLDIVLWGTGDGQCHSCLWVMKRNLRRLQRKLNSFLPGFSVTCNRIHSSWCAPPKILGSQRGCGVHKEVQMTWSLVNTKLM